MTGSQKQLTPSSHSLTPFLLDVIESDSIIVPEQKVAGASVEDRLTGRALDLLGDFIAKILDDQLQEITTLIY